MKEVLKCDEINSSKTLILTVGLPYSGKSTWAKKQNCPVVNPDSIRISLHGKKFIKETESMVWVMAKYMVKSLFLAGHDHVILDATNLSSERRLEWSDEWTLRYQVFDCDKEECKKRAAANNDFIIIPIIDKMYDHYDYPINEHRCLI